MAEAGLLKSKQKLTVAEIQENLQTVLGAGADTSAAMASLGLSAAIEGQEHQTVQLTAKKLQELVTTHALTKAQAQELAMRTGVMLSMKTQAATTMPTWIANMKAMTLATWKQVAATIAWLATKPETWVAAAVAGVAALTAHILKSNVTIEEQKEKLKETKEAWEDAKNELQKIETELQNNVDRIKELENTPNLTWVEQAELDRLREATKELERQKKLKQDEQLDKAEDLYEENKKTFDKEFGDFYPEYVEEIKQKLLSGETTISFFKYNDLDDDLTHTLGILQYINEIKGTLTDEADIAELDKYTAELFEKYPQYLTTLYNYKQNIREIASVRELTEDEQKFYDYISSIQKMIYEVYDPATWNNIEFNSIFNTDGIEKTKEELIALQKAGELSPEVLQSYPKLCEAIERSGIIAGEESDVFKEFYNEIAALADKQADVVGHINNATFSDIFATEDVENTLNALGQLNEQLNNIQSAYKNLADAMDTYSSAGYITIDQFQSIVEQGANFLDYLTLEDGQLGINEQAMYDLAKARIAEMKAQAIQGVVDNVSKIETEADADLYLASTNYDLADSYHTLAEAQLLAWSTSALEKGLSQDYVDKVTQKARNDINKFRALVNKVDFKNFSGAASSSAAEQAEKDWKNVLDKETDLLEKQLAANVITFKEYTDKRRQIIEDYYRDGKIKAEEYYDALESMYNHQLSLYDRVVNAVTDRIDDEIDRLNEQKEAIENSYQVKIDAIQEEIDALNKANDARQKQIDLEKAQYEAERARNQRVNKVYDGSQFVYAVDMEAVRDAEDDLADKKFRMNISRLETQIESLKEEMENATRSLDNQIDALEAYKSKWNEISGVYQKQQDKLLAAEVMGSEWERDILNGRLDTLRSFTEQYIALQQAQIDIAAKAAKIKAENEAGNTTGGDDDDPPKDPPKYGVVYEGTAKTVRTFDTKAEAQSYANYMNKVHYRDGFMYYVKQYASGTDHARKGLNLVGEDGTETFIDNDDNVALVTKPTLIPMEGGEVVKNAEETKAMLDTGNIEPAQSKNVKALYDHIRNLPPSAFDFQSLMQQPLSAMINFPNKDYSHMLHNTSAEHNIVHIDNNNVSINCPNVTNNSGAEYIMKEFRRLPLDTIQYMHRRNK